jgi:prevent-host-death family protein
MIIIMTPGDLSDILPVTTVKRRFLKLVKELGSQRSVITVTRNGVPACVVMSVEEYESLSETLEILADPEVTGALRRARRNFSKGRTLRHEEVWPRE